MQFKFLFLLLGLGDSRGFPALRSYLTTQKRFFIEHQPPEIKTLPAKSSSALGASNISLDRTLLPRQSSVSSNGLAFSLLATLLVYFLRRFIFDGKPFFGTSEADSFLDRASYAVRSLFGNFSAFLNSVSSFLSKCFRKISLPDDNKTALRLDDWSVCTVGSKETLNGGQYVKYRFNLQNPVLTLGLFLGQELQICLTDEIGAALKGGFFPVTASSEKGYFEIIVKRSSSGEYAYLVEAFDNLSIGDEVAIKAGNFRLNYAGEDDPIKYLTVIASGLGISPSLELLRTTLSDVQSTVEEVEFLWLNEHSRDFICEEDVHTIEVSSSKLTSTRLVEFDLVGRDYTQIDNILSAISPYEPGRIVVVCAPSAIVSNFLNLFSKIGYPKQNLLCIETPE